VNTPAKPPPASPLWVLALFVVVFVFGMVVGARLVRG
jgi:hypothetical protein